MQRRTHTSSYRDAGMSVPLHLPDSLAIFFGRERTLYLVAAIAGASVHCVFFIDEDEIDAGIAACVLAILFWQCPKRGS
jgi:hypothetical protein